MSEQVVFKLVDHMQKVEEELRAEKEKMLKIVEDFHNTIRASQFMEQYLTWLRRSHR